MQMLNLQLEWNNLLIIWSWELLCLCCNLLNYPKTPRCLVAENAVSAMLFEVLIILVIFRYNYGNKVLPLDQIHPPSDIDRHFCKKKPVHHSHAFMEFPLFPSTQGVIS